MSKVYTQFNSIDGLAGAAFGGGGGGGGRRRPSQNNSVEMDRSKAHFSGPARESENRRTGNSTALMHAKQQSESQRNPADRKCLAIAGGTAAVTAVFTRNPKKTAEAFSTAFTGCTIGEMF